MARSAPHPFTLRQLQYAAAVAELLSFRRAAEQCRVAQPSLSAQIAQLEDALGFRLFERLPRGVLLTTRGEAFLERARKILLEADDLVAFSAKNRDPFAGTLRIGVIPSVAPYLLPHVAPALRKLHPQLSIVWVEEKTAPLVERLARGDLDGGIVALESVLGDLDREAIAKDPFLLAVPPGHPLARGKGPVAVSVLDGETVLVLEDGHCFRDQALSLCRRVGADEAAVRATSLSTLAQMVASGAGITLLPALSAETENRARGLCLRSFTGQCVHRTLAFVFRKQAPAAEALRPMAKELRPLVEGLLQRR